MNDRRYCKHCGQQLPDDVPEELAEKLTSIQRTIFKALYKAGRHGLPRERLYQLVYGTWIRSDDCLKVHIHNIRKQLKGTGYRIDSRGWGRMEGSMASYRLVKE